MFRMIATLVIGLGVFYVHNSMYVSAVQSIDASEKRRYERVNLSQSERRARRRAQKRYEAKLEKTPLKAYGKVEKAKALARIETGCKFLVKGFARGRVDANACGCIAKGMKRRLNSKQVNFVYAGAKQGGLRLLAGRTTSMERLRLTYGMSRNSAEAITRRVAKITKKCMS